jgi:hypothetical protein
MQMRNEPLQVGCVLDDGGSRYRIVWVVAPPNERAFGHAWAEVRDEG